MLSIDLSNLIREGLAALDLGNTSFALTCFEEAARWRQSALVLSCLAYCRARERGETEAAIDLCRMALRQEPANPLHYLNLGRTHLLAGKKHLAIAAFKRGLQWGRHQEIVQEIQNLGARRKPFFPRLGRKHPLNRTIGLFLSRLGG